MVTITKRMIDIIKIEITEITEIIGVVMTTEIIGIVMTTETLIETATITIEIEMNIG